MTAPEPVEPAVLSDDVVTLPNGPRLALRRAEGARRPFLLVHGLASNARLWDGVARRLAVAGHEVAAVDQRGHGRSEATADGYDTATAAADLAALCTSLGWTGAREPVLAGQSWGGNVVLTTAAVHGGAAGVALVDGGWIHLSDRFPTFEECWGALAPPRFDHLTAAELETRSHQWGAGWPEEGRRGALANFTVGEDGTVRPRLTRDHHQSIVHSLWADDPRPLYPRVAVPVLLMAAVESVPTRETAVTEALEAIPDAEVSWYVGAHHDLHAQDPDRCAADLLALAARTPGLGSPSHDTEESTP
ncbi:MAG TPA: alpha/beta hydrolase [Candidatus Limnocylindria bacterium]|nr:alpha/beta hydrolase [Candidatus Limnocylindria bacterium]